MRRHLDTGLCGITVPSDPGDAIGVSGAFEMYNVRCAVVVCAFLAYLIC